MNGILLLNIRLPVFLILFFILPLVTCLLWGQVVQKKDLTAADYHLWGALSLEKISPDQNWASYSMTYDNTIDTLFVRNTITLKTFSFPGVHHSIFTKNNTFIYLNNQEVKILELDTGKQRSIKSADHFDYSATADLLIVTTNLSEDKKKLTIQNPNGKVVREIDCITGSSLSPDQQHLIYGTFINGKHSVILFNLKKTQQEKLILTNHSDRSFGFTWHKDGNAVAFATKSDLITETLLFYYTLENKKLFKLDLTLELNLPKNTFIPSDFTFKLTVSDDMQKVFFTTKINSQLLEKKNSTDVEVWNANDKSLFVEKVKNGSLLTVPRTVLWLPASKLVKQLTTNELPKMMLSGDQQYALLFNPKEYEPQFKLQQGLSDVYIINLNTFKKRLLLKEHPANNFELTVSTTGKYIAYFKEGNWWIYTIATAVHHNITKNIPTTFSSVDPHYSITSKKANAGWSNDDNEILLYDDFDLWSVKADGSSFRRLTHGRESKIRYRLANIPGKQIYTGLYDGQQSYNFDIEKELYLHAQGDDGKTGYFRWNTTSGEKAIVYKDSHIDQLAYSSRKEYLYYREQRFDLSPRVMAKKKESDPVCVFQSNPQQKNYFWGSSELIEYENKKGVRLKGVLRYPANYDALKKYPMIVHIYQRQNQEQHKYINPSLSLEDADNDAIWTTQGYFVLRPDIITEPDFLGYSALDCVSAAVNKVLEKGVIKSNKIGLIGHSFGAYQANFIITQTNLFAAAVSSAGSSDLNSFYFTLAKNFYFPNMFRFTDGQWKTSNTPFETPEVYQLNSPINYADKINTPLLLWSGKEDYNVDPHQSMEFYFALRLLGKKCIMLLYPEEGHGISKPINQIDMINRVQQWFAYYLKDDLSAQWITEGVK